MIINKMNNKIKFSWKVKIFALMMVVILISLTEKTYGIGITPGRTTIDFEPNLQRTVDVKVINNEKKDMKVSLFAKGELGELVEISGKELIFTKDEEEKTFSYKVTLPQTLEPGLRQAEIIARESSIEENKKEATVSALVAVVSQLNVNVPYPGKYIKIDLEVGEAKQGEKTIFYVPVKNLGNDGLESVRPRIIIYDSQGSEVTRINGDSVALASGSSYEFKIEWGAEVTSGMYKAVAVVEYDGNRVTAERNFLVGEFFIKPLDISVNNFKLGQVAKFNILIENVANNQIQDAYAKIQLQAESGRRVANIESLPTIVEPMQRKEIVAYWDTSDVSAGTYTGLLRIGYGDKLSEKQIRTVVDEDTITTEIIGVTGFAINTKQGGKASNFNYMYIIIGLLVIANIVWLIYYKKKQEVKVQ